MRGFYLKFRIALMTFTLGLASVFAFNGSLKYSKEVSIDLPKVKTDEVIVVFPGYTGEMPWGTSSRDGRTLDPGYAVQKQTKPRK